jgi:hypothetical protein
MARMMSRLTETDDGPEADDDIRLHEYDTNLAGLSGGPHP